MSYCLQSLHASSSEIVSVPATSLSVAKIIILVLSWFVFKSGNESNVPS